VERANVSSYWMTLRKWAYTGSRGRTGSHTPEDSFRKRVKTYGKPHYVKN